MPVRITWASAKPIKLAIAQKNYGVEAGSRPEVISAVERVESDYIITVDGIPSNAARQGPDEAAASIEERCTLRCAGKTDRIPTKAKITQGEIGTLALITFPRNEPYSLGGKEVEFTIKLGSDTLRQRFKLKDMVFDGKLEL